MEIKKYLKAMPVLAALLLTVSCSNEDNEIVESPQPEQVRTVPFTVTAGSGSLTRATLDDNNKYQFDKTDHLYVWSEDGNVYGELEYGRGYDDSDYGISDDPHKATFSGNLTITSGGTLTKEVTTLYAVIKSKKDQILGTLDYFIGNNFEPNYTLATTFATSNEEAVQMFSYLKAKATYKDNTYFNFGEYPNSQNSAFLSFDVTLEDGASAGDVSATIKNGEATLQSGTVAAAADVSGKVHAKFVAGFPSGTELYNATVTVGSRPAINFGSTISSAKTTLAANKIYQVTKDYNGYKITTSATVPIIGSVNNKVLASGIGLPYVKTMAELLSQYGAGSSLAASVSKCEYAANSDTDPVVLSGDNPNYVFTVSSEGTSTFVVTTGFGTIDDLSITVSKLISPNLSDLP